ncbi:MAG TPA: hypothetical protein VMV68_00355 [Spirochaetia bacterium]|nr:hypothetical protein [Spirochaetia bacterium]
MQEIIEEILQTEAQCAQRLAEERAAAAASRSEAENQSAARIRSVREEIDREIGERAAKAKLAGDHEVEEAVASAHADREARIAALRGELGQVVDRIVEIVADAEI